MSDQTQVDGAVASTSQRTLEMSAPPILLGSATHKSTSVKPGAAFFRDARICPDGSCALVAADDRSLSLFAFPPPTESPWEPIWVYIPPDALLSFEWFPGATSAVPAMFAFAVAIKDHPVHLLDGADHSLRASYPIIDHQERFVAPHAMAFSPDGRELYCGFDTALEVFDVARPGHPGERIRTSPNRSSKAGQKGIISSLAFAPDHSGLLAAGSFAGTVGLYDTTAEGCPLVKLLRSKGEVNGVTGVVFHPAGHLLYVASRLLGAVEVWDLRNLRKAPARLQRKGRTNQRLGLDVDPTGEWLLAGDQDGMLSCFSAEYDEEHGAPLVRFGVAEDAIGSVHFLPYQHGQVLVCSGSRHLQDSLDLDSSDDEAGGAEESHGRAAKSAPRAIAPSLQLWQFT